MALQAADVEACYQRVEQGLFNVLLRMLWDVPACQDVIQEAFLKLWSQRTRLRADDLDALAYTTAINLARNRLRWQRLRHWVGLEVLDESGGHNDGMNADLLTLRQALADIDGRDREVLLLSEYAGFNTRELAMILGIAPGTVGSRRHRALKRLRQHMGEREHDGK